MTASMATYANSFWGNEDQGVEIIMTKLRHSKQSLQDVQTLFSTRAAIEEEYGKKLLKLSKTDFGKDEVGTLKESLKSIKEELEFVGKSHVDLADQIKTELEKSMSDFMTTQKEIIKNQRTIVERNMKAKTSHIAAVQRAKERYNMEVLKAQGGHPTKSQIGTDVVNRIMGNTAGNPRAAEVEFKESNEKMVHSARVFQEEWRQACDKFQILEEERIEFMRDTLWKYTNVFAGICVTNDESYERVRQSLEKCDIDADIQTFIGQFGTGGPDTCTIPKIEIAPYVPAAPIPKIEPAPVTGANVSQQSQGTGMSLAQAAMYASGQTGYQGPGYQGQPQQPGYQQQQPGYQQPQQQSPQQQQPPPQQQQQPGYGYRPGINSAFPIAATNYPPTMNPTYQQPPGSNGRMQYAPQRQNSASRRDSYHQPGYAATSIGISQPPQQPEPQRPASVIGTTTLPPRPIQFYVKALYDYDAEMEEELTFKEGQVIGVLTTQLDGWWEGEIRDGNVQKRGQFPSNFTEPVSF